MASMLRLEGLSKHFGGVKAVDHLEIQIEKGEIYGLIGPNGSGKSTTVNLICGIYPATRGKVVFQNEEITNRPPHRRLRSGIARTFQNIRLFENLTVWQNLWVAQNSQHDVARQNPLARWFGSSAPVREEIEKILEFSQLTDKSNELAGSLAFGEQRRLELARSVAAKPSLLLLDEPAAGMSLEEVEELDERIVALRDSGITILLVEHVMELVMSVTDRIAVLNFGKKIAEGTPTEIQNHPKVQEAYLGTSNESA
jgi:branched-chain amino acid transport system ATP-binding protein